MKVPDVIVYSKNYPRGEATIVSDTPVGVTVTYVDPATGKTATKTKKKGER